MEYLFLLVPISFYIISYLNEEKYEQIKNGGKIPEIRTAKNNATLFFALSLVLLTGFFFVRMYNKF